MTRILASIAFAAFTAVVAAQTPAVSALSPIPPNFSFTGSWRCIGAMGGGTRPHEANFQGEVVLGGKWLQLREQDVIPATTYTAIYLIGWDPAQSRMVMFDANNFGAFVYAGASGWQGKVLTLESQTANGAPAAWRFVYTLVDANTFTDDWQVRKPGGDWTPGDHLACRRQGTPA